MITQQAGSTALYADDASHPRIRSSGVRPSASNFTPDSWLVIRMVFQNVCIVQSAVVITSSAPRLLFCCGGIVKPIYPCTYIADVSNIVDDGEGEASNETNNVLGRFVDFLCRNNRTSSAGIYFRLPPVSYDHGPSKLHTSALNPHHRQALSKRQHVTKPEANPQH